ncbi:putative phosphoenolpyruvate synthase [Caerostris extrusa]|uniref:Phosphoenolpyruvate synthase n=1 Tax=Caerostris extrusa TaxID=172846 RepID=A0AAV4XVR0_CAEEX|nr:putative phosphoenolpyruvate synthase [Caerostris extrusa]
MTVVEYLFSFDFGYHEVKNKIYNHPLEFLKLKTAKETFTALIISCSDFDDAAHFHMQCSDGSQNWNMSILKTLIKAKGEIDNDIYSDFARLLAASSNVESANIPSSVAGSGCSNCEGHKLQKKFKSMSMEEALEWLQTTNMPSGDTFRQFLKRHGHRCIQESDVRSITWEMEPKSLVKLLQNLAGAGKEVAKNKNDIDNVLSELQVPLGFISKCYLRFVLPMCRRGIRGREAGKAITMKAFDHWRKGYRRLGKLMVSEGRLPDADLLYFFTLEEVKELLETRSPGLISKAIHRRKMYPTLEKYVFPEIMKGLPKPINDEDDSADAHEYVADLTMKGTPVSQAWEILITLSTDIGWSPYFPIVSGVVTEIGGLISHGAVISREYGIPCIVGLQGATKKFRTGDYILLDGKKGILQRLPQPE